MPSFRCFGSDCVLSGCCAADVAVGQKTSALLNLKINLQKITYLPYLTEKV